MKRKMCFALMVMVSTLGLYGCSAGEDGVINENEIGTSEQGAVIESEIEQEAQATYDTEFQEEGDKGVENDANQYEEKTIEGYEYVDGSEVPVTVTFAIENIQKGEEAYSVLQKENTDIAQPKDNEEYIIVTFNVSYDGEIEELYMMENRASLESAGLYFALSNSQSNAQDVTAYLSNSIYNVSIFKGESEQGAVAFLQEKGNAEPLYFVGFGKSIQFNVNEHQNEEYVTAQVKVYEGSYIDERGVYDVGPAEESDLVYCYVVTSNVTANSFDFEINEMTLKTGNVENVIPESTAYFIEDGKKAVCYGEQQVLYFLFDDDQVNPTIGRMTITGMEKLEGNIYMNNQIPGHEAG